LKGRDIIPVFTGHSLGGGLATILDLEYCDLVEQRGNNAFSPLLGTPVCITFGSPRVLSKGTSTNFCKKIVSNKTLFHRYSNDGDPVTALPPTIPFGYYHPCSSDTDKSSGNRKLVSRDCKSSTTVRPVPKSEYTKAINCRDVEASTFTKAINAGPNIFDHMTYLYISFVKAADIVHLFGKSAFTVETSEIGRVNQTVPTFSVTSGDTEERIVTMTGNGGPGVYTSDFVDLVKLRKKGNGVLYEDSLDSYKLFSDILYVNKDNVSIEFVEKTKLPVI
jgi:hypothetical protein